MPEFVAAVGLIALIVLGSPVDAISEHLRFLLLCIAFLMLMVFAWLADWVE